MKIKNIQKSAFLQNLVKAYTEGIYADTPANRKLGRVGMSYAEYAKKVAGEGEKDVIKKESKSLFTNSKGENFIKGEKVIATLSDGSKVEGIIKEYLPDFNIVNLKNPSKEKDGREGWGVNINKLEKIKQEENIEQKKPVIKENDKASNIDIDKQVEELISDFKENEKPIYNLSSSSEEYKKLNSKLEEINNIPAFKYARVQINPIYKKEKFEGFEFIDSGSSNLVFEKIGLDDLSKLKDILKSPKEYANKIKNIKNKINYLINNYKVKKDRGGIKYFQLQSKLDSGENNYIAYDPNQFGWMHNWHIEDDGTGNYKILNTEEAINYIYKNGIKKEEKIEKNPFES